MQNPIKPLTVLTAADKIYATLAASGLSHQQQLAALRVVQEVVGADSWEVPVSPYPAIIPASAAAAQQA